MAKVKCIYCKQYFDREKEPYVEVKPKRYAHQNCAKNFNMLLSQEERDELALEQYIEHLFEINYITPKIKAQWNSYLKAPYRFSNHGILLTLKYWYEVKKNDISKSKGGIGIVPSIYKEAKDYYYNIWLANQKNADAQEIKHEVQEIHIVAPERKAMHKKMFSFLDDEEV